MSPSLLCDFSLTISSRERKKMASLNNRLHAWTRGRDRSLSSLEKSTSIFLGRDRSGREANQILASSCDGRLTRSSSCLRRSSASSCARARGGCWELVGGGNRGRDKGGYTEGAGTWATSRGTRRRPAGVLADEHEGNGGGGQP
jgi:hypothetical protein